MTKTPLLASSIESFVHGIEHYFLVYGHSNKFPLLHIDQSIELLLKAKIQNMNGLSIYTKKGKTIDYHECFNRLEQKDIKIPEKSLLEEIHDKRNSSQHLGASFDDYTIGYYIKFTHSFFKFFLKEHFDDELEAYLPDNIKTYLDNIIVEPTKIHEDQLQYINELIEEGRYKDSIISSWNAIEFLIRGYSDRDTGKSIDEIIKSIKEKKQIDDGKPFKYLEEIKTLKDNIIFSNEEVDQETAIGIHDKIIDIANTNIVIVPVKTAEKISSKRISSDEDAEPVRIIDDTSPVDDIQELYYTTLKLYNSSNKYCSNFEEIFSLYKSRHQLTIDEQSGYEFLTQSSIYHKLPFWYWAKNLTDDEISKIIKRNLDTWPYNTVYYSLDVLLLLSNQESDDILRKLSNDRRISIVKKASDYLQMKKNVMEIKDHFQITPLRTLEHYKKINPHEVSLPRPFSENIKNIESEEEIHFFSIIKENNFLEALEQYYNNGDETIRKNILEALSYIKDKDSFLFYLTKIRTNQEYNMYKKSIQKLDIALYCPKLN